MPNYILTTGSVVLCPHGGVVNHIPMGTGDFLIEGMPPMLLTDTYLVSGCPNASGGGASPCLNVFWINPSNYLFVRGVPALTNISTGLVADYRGAPAGPAIITSFQTTYEEPSKLTLID